MPSLTRATLVTRIGQLIGDPDNTKFSASEKQDRLQEAQEKFVLDTRVLVDVAQDSAVDGTQEYNLPSDCMAINRVTHKGLLLTRKAKFDLDLMGLDWTDTANKGTPKYYYVDTDPNNKKFGLYPIPGGSDAGSNNLRIEYIKIPPTLSSDSSVPLDGHTLLTPYHEALAYSAAANLLMIEPDQKAVKMAADYRAEYEKIVTSCIDAFKNLEEASPMRFRGGRYHKGL